jgi:hypothetical protein
MVCVGLVGKGGREGVVEGDTEKTGAPPSLQEKVFEKSGGHIGSAFNIFRDVTRNMKG